MMYPASGRLRLPALAALASTVALALGASATPAAAQAPEQPGEITGKVLGSKPSSKRGAIVVRAFNAGTGAVADVATVNKRGTYTLVVPPGAYAVRATVIAPGRRAGDATIPVTVKEGQKRAGVTFKARKSGKVAKASKATRARAARATAPKAHAAYVSEDGAETAGVTSYVVEEFEGGSKDWKHVGRALSALIQTELYDSTTCPTVGIANDRERRYLERSLKFRSGRVVSKGTKVQRNMIVADLAVVGKLSGGGSRVRLSVGLVDRKTGKTFNGFDGSLTKGTFTKKVRSYAKKIAERLCRVPPAYQLTLSLNGTVDVQSHVATGVIAATMTAKQTSGNGGQPDSTWRGDSKLSWSQIAYKNKTSDKCPYTDIVPPSGTWTASLSVLDGQLTVDWGADAAFYLTFTSASLACPGQPIVPNQPGPSFAGVLPNAQRLPLSGGVLPVSGDLNVANQVVHNEGTLTVTPVWTLPDA